MIDDGAQQEVDWSRAGLATRAIHAGQAPDPATGAVVPPIYVSSTYKQDGVGGLRAGYDYSRAGNPTRRSLEEALAAVEGGSDALSFASGLAAEDALLRSVLRPGDHIVVPDDAYGGTYRLMSRLYGPWQVDHTPVSSSDPEAVAAAVQTGRTRLVWVETPSNPLLGISDVAALAEVAHTAGALLVVDNTFATPALQQPVALGADVVVHSTTKYVGGHSDVLGGALVVAPGVRLPGGLVGPTGTDDLVDAVRFQQLAAGAVLGPFDAFLTLRGLKSLEVRMERHSSNGLQIATHLAARLGPENVMYPGLTTHPSHRVAARQMQAFGGMVSFRVGSEQRARDLVDRTRVFTLAESLGGVESLIEHPYAMTHASVVGSALEVPSDLVRASVGLESAGDLMADLDQALESTED